jgi:hypothetical protein
MKHKKSTIGGGSFLAIIIAILIIWFLSTDNG